MYSVMHVLGGYPLAGVLAVVLAGAALLFWEYLRLTGPSRVSEYLPLLRVVAVSLTILSVVLITSRFLFMERLF